MTRSRSVSYLFYVLPFVLVVVAAFGSVRYYRDDQCKQQKHAAEQLRAVVIKATEPQPSGTPLDLTKAEGFDKLDPVTQTWARSVQQMISSRPSSTSSVRDTLLAVIPPVTC